MENLMDLRDVRLAYRENERWVFWLMVEYGFFLLWFALGVQEDGEEECEVMKRAAIGKGGKRRSES